MRGKAEVSLSRSSGWWYAHESVVCTLVTSSATLPASDSRTAAATTASTGARRFARTPTCSPVRPNVTTATSSAARQVIGSTERQTILATHRPSLTRFTLLLSCKFRVVPRRVERDDLAKGAHKGRDILICPQAKLHVMSQLINNIPRQDNANDDGATCQSVVQIALRLAGFLRPSLRGRLRRKSPYLPTGTKTKASLGGTKWPAAAESPASRADHTPDKV